jgi:hypothetical protein
MNHYANISVVVFKTNTIIVSLLGYFPSILSNCNQEEKVSIILYTFARVRKTKRVGNKAHPQMLSGDSQLIKNIYIDSKNESEQNKLSHNE